MSAYIYIFSDSEEIQNGQEIETMNLFFESVVVFFSAHPCLNSSAWVLLRWQPITTWRKRWKNGNKETERWKNKTFKSVSLRKRSFCLSLGLLSTQGGILQPQCMTQRAKRDLGIRFFWPPTVTHQNLFSFMWRWAINRIDPGLAAELQVSHSVQVINTKKNPDLQHSWVTMTDSFRLSETNAPVKAVRWGSLGRLNVKQCIPWESFTLPVHPILLELEAWETWLTY